MGEGSEVNRALKHYRSFPFTLRDNCINQPPLTFSVPRTSRLVGSGTFKNKTPFRLFSDSMA